MTTTMRKFEANRRKANTRQRLLDVAASIVSREGFSRLTIRGVANEAKLSTGIVYKHFESKSVLCVEMYVAVATIEFELIKHILLGPGTVISRISRTIEAFALRAYANPMMAYSLGSEPVEPLVAEQRLIFKQGYIALFQEVMQEGIRTNEFEDQNASITAGSLVGVISASVLDPLAYPVERTLIQNAHTILAIQRFCVAAVMHPITLGPQ